MAAMSRRKGIAAELEIAAVIRDITGWQIKRRVRQHQGDSDLEGVPGWSVEVKRHATIGRADLDAFWLQAVRQCNYDGGHVPVLFFRRNRDQWRAVWPMAVQMQPDSLRAVQWIGYEWTCEGSIDAWAAVARERIENE